MSRVYASDDYAGLEAGPFKFYFGYEETICLKHGTNTDPECDSCEWAFVVTKGERELVRYSASDIGFPDDHHDMPEWGILKGIAKYLEAKTES